MQTIDLRNVQATGFIREEGVYNGVITNVVEGSSKGSGALQHQIMVATPDGLEGTIYMTWTEKMMGRNKSDLMLLGMDVETQAFDPSNLIGTPIKFEAKYSNTTTRDALGKEVQTKSDFLGMNILGRGEVTGVAPQPTGSPVTPQGVPNTNVTNLEQAPQGTVQPQAQMYATPEPHLQPQATVAPQPQVAQAYAPAPQVEVAQAFGQATPAGQPQIGQPQVMTASDTTVYGQATPNPANIPGLNG